jgi:16S rRNA (guanine527-N7)-methyltransferase
MTAPRTQMRQTFDRDTLDELLRSGAAELGVVLSDKQCGQLLDYVALLAKWNSVYNLTAIRDPRQMLIQHILDSLSIVPHVAARECTSILDVGSGGGLPGSDAQRYRAEKDGISGAGQGGIEARQSVRGDRAGGNAAAGH